MEWLFDDILKLLIPYVSKVLGALVTLLVGWILSGRLSNGLKRALKDREIDPSLKGYLSSFLELD